MSASRAKERRVAAAIRACVPTTTMTLYPCLPLPPASLECIVISGFIAPVKASSVDQPWRRVQQPWPPYALRMQVTRSAIELIRPRLLWMECATRRTVSI